jgi:hypothetical protein
MSSAARLMTGITLLTVPTIMFGGLTVLGVLTSGAAGIPGGPELTAVQYALYRAGHAHAGVLLVLSIVLQVLLDHARLPVAVSWSARGAAPLAAILVSGGFFGIAYVPALRAVLYAGAALVAYATLTAGVGLLRSLRRSRSVPATFGAPGPVPA